MNNPYSYLFLSRNKDREQIYDQTAKRRIEDCQKDNLVIERYLVKVSKRVATDGIETSI